MPVKDIFILMSFGLKDNESKGQQIQMLLYN